MTTRREVIVGAAAVGLASVGLPAWARGGTGDTRPLAALLLPLTGTGADLARSLHHAASLAQPLAAAGGAKPPPLPVFDCGTGSDGGAAAARAAIATGAPLLIGPVYGPQVAGALAAAGGVPVLTLSNDADVARGSFVLGITAGQAVGAILGYARARGVRRVMVAAGPSRWDMAAAAAAAIVARDLGLVLTADAPDAVLVPGDADALTAAARARERDGPQLLGTYQGLALTGAGLDAIDGAWLAAPDPAAFAEFARRFETAFGNPPGALAGLAYDAASIARSLRASGHGDPASVRDALTGSAGFPGVAGAVRFRADGSATRELAILVADGGSFRAVARSQPA